MNKSANALEPSGDHAYKRVRLRRMQWIATSLLLAMLVTLFLCAALQATYPWLQWVRAAAEAGAIGAMADWYAVVALFRYPLGLPIPHTAIIPRKKDSIGESLGDFVEKNFLTAENIVARLQDYDLAKAAAEWLANPQNSRKLAETVAEFIPGILDGFQDEDLRRFFDGAFTSQLLRVDVARLAGNILSLLTDQGRHQTLLDRILAAVERLLRQHQGTIVTKVGEELKYTPAFVDEILVRKFLEGFIALLHDVAADPQHDLRLQFDAATNELMHDLKTSPEYREKGRLLLEDWVQHLRGESYYRALWQDVRKQVKADLGSQDSVLVDHLAQALVATGVALLKEPLVQRKFNAWWLDAVRGVVARYGRQISRLIADVVKGWDAADVSGKIELEIGRDLQFIRINGTVVGAAVGIVLHGLTTAFF